MSATAVGRNFTTKQTDAAEAQLAILRRQIKDAEDTGRSAVEVSLTELEATARHWDSRLDNWGQLTPQPGLELLPDQWGVALEYARKTSGELYKQLHDLQLAANEVSQRIDHFTSKPLPSRDEVEAKKIHDILFEILKQCRP